MEPNKGGEPTKQFCGNLLVLCWNDVTQTKSTKLVSMLLTIHRGKLVDSGKKFRNTQDPVFKPDVIVYNNQNMGDGDLLSTVLISYSCQMQGVKWYRKLAELFLDVSLYNFFIAWSNLNPFTKMTHLTFRRKLITEIITFHSFGSKLPKVAPKTTVDNALRLTEKHYIELYPRNGKKASPQIKCVICRTHKIRYDSRYWCPDCGVGLCMKNCFKVYHTVPGYKREDDPCVDHALST